MRSGVSRVEVLEHNKGEVLHPRDRRFAYSLPILLGIEPFYLGKSYCFHDLVKETENALINLPISSILEYKLHMGGKLAILMSAMYYIYILCVYIYIKCVCNITHYRPSAVQ